MQADKQEKEFLHSAIDEWLNNGLLTQEHAAKLKATIVTERSGRQQLANYFFIIALSCALLAFGALFIDEKLLQWLQRTFLLHNFTIAIGTALLGVLCYWQAARQRAKATATSTEVNLIPGTLSFLISLVYVCKETGNGAGYNLFLGMAAILLLVLCIGFRSRLLWAGFLLAIMGWFGAFSTAFSEEHLFLGMNYPVRFTVFGAIILAMSYAQRFIPALKRFSQISYHAGLLITLTALWGLSVFGNYGHLEEWAAVRQTQVLGFAGLFGAATGIGLYLGIRYNDAATRDYCILFFLLNLYTRYFEYFWDSINKGIFFSVLAISFWLVGRWLVGRNKEQSA